MIIKAGAQTWSRNGEACECEHDRKTAGHTRGEMAPGENHRTEGIPNTVHSSTV